MQRHVPRHLTAYTITALVYFFIVVMFYYSQIHHFVSSSKPKKSVLKMSLSAFVPEVVSPPEKIESIVKEEPKPAKEVEVQKKVIEPIAKRELPKTIVRKKPIIKKIIIAKPKKQKSKKVKKSKKTKKQIRKKQQVSSEQTQSTKADQNKFWSALQRKIDKHKSYPRIAKKRRMEGVVKVKFTVLANGKVANVSLTGPKVFHNSARSAIKSAFPMNVKKSPVSFPVTINITLNYQVR